MINNRRLLNAPLYIVENDCKRRGLPKEYDNRHAIYLRRRSLLRGSRAAG